MIHYLKTREPWFGRVVAGEKTAEIRVHDRDFQPGDELVLVRTEGTVSATAEGLLEYEPDRPTARVRVTHVADAKQVSGLMEGYCMLSFERLPEPERAKAMGAAVPSA